MTGAPNFACSPAIVTAPVRGAASAPTAFRLPAPVASRPMPGIGSAPSCRRVRTIIGVALGVACSS